MMQLDYTFERQIELEREETPETIRPLYERVKNESM